MKKILESLNSDKGFWIFICITAILVIVLELILMNSPLRPWARVIYSDGHGYYAYLPAVFIYNDIFMNFTKDPIPWCDFTSISFNILPNGQLFDKYPIGIALMQLPFFLVTHIFTSLTKIASADGYSMPYQISAGFCAFVYWTIGAKCLYNIIKEKFTQNIALITVIAFTFATNLFIYLSAFSTISHIYCFSLSAIIIYLILNEKKWEKREKLYSYLLGLLAGLLFLTKAINILILLIYIFYTVVDKQTFIERMKTIFRFDRLKFNFLGIIIPVALQLGYMYKISGQLFVNTYYNESFFWTSPRIIDVLFGPTKGILFYAPVLIIAFIGFIWFKNHFKEIFYSATAFFIIELYIIMCWWTGWFQGDSFGSRMLVDFYPVLMLTFACALFYIFQKPVIKQITCVFMGLCLILCSFEAYLYLTKSLPEECGLSSYKELLSYRLIRNSFVSRVKYVNGKKYLVQDYAFPCTVLKFPIGHYKVSIFGHNLTQGVYNFSHNIYDMIENPKEIEFSDSKIVYEFDVTDKQQWIIPFIDNKAPENKYIDVNLIILDRVPVSIKYNPNVDLEFNEITEIKLPTEINEGEYLITLKNIKLNKKDYKILSDKKVLRTYQNKSDDNSTSFKVRVPKDKTQVTMEILLKGNKAQSVSEIDIQETDSFNYLYDLSKGKQLYPNSNPANWTDEARER